MQQRKEDFVSYNYELPIRNINQIKAPIFQQKSDYLDTVIGITQRNVYSMNLFKNTYKLLELEQEVLDIFYIDSNTILVVQFDGENVFINLINIDDLKQLGTHSFTRKSKLGKKYIKSRLFTPQYHQMTLYLLDKKEMQQSEGIQNLYELKIFSICEQSISNIKTVDFTATVRQFYHEPLSHNLCLLYNPNHLTTKQFQFLIWDDSQESQNKIQVKQTKYQLKGTVLNVFPYYENEQVNAIILYNSNGVTAPFILYYNIESQEEKHFQLKQEKSYIMLESQIKKDKLYITCTDITSKFILEFDLKLNQISQRVNDCLSNLFLLPSPFIGTYQQQQLKVTMPFNYKGIQQLHFIKSIINDNDVINDILKIILHS